ncbi:MAG TPA: EAL domain-containing protein [Acidimicrobiales bacterium]|nr:EAL domain-containing protein [Acidimicrobiales bacterium]
MANLTGVELASLAAIVEASPDLILIVQADGRISYCSPAAGPMLGRVAEHLDGQPVAGLVHLEDQVKLADLVRRRAAGEGAVAGAELRMSHVLGSWVDVEVTIMDLREHPDVGGVVLHARDVRPRKEQEEQLRHLALHDALTGLANRALFRDHVEHALAHLRRTPVRHAVLFFDLDRFKTINDSLGHAAGDELLSRVAERLRSRLRPGDVGARLGGDEFAVLLENTSERDAVEVAQRVLDALHIPFAIQGRDVAITASVGIAFSDLSENAEALLRNADVAMYKAKASGKGRHALFEPDMHHAALRRLSMEASLTRAVERDELVLHYQPIVNLRSGAMTGMEVLVRWLHPEQGLVPPMEFIAVAEETGLIEEIGREVLVRSCAQVQAWQGRFNWPGLRLCVNASVRQIESQRFLGEVQDALARSGLTAGDLTLEITESLFMSDIEPTIERLRRLKELGIKLAVDDFGTGYSSLNYLRILPIDVLKIDKAFVDGVTNGPEQAAVARAVVKLARTFGLETVAEGIEHPEQLDELTEIGADFGQGYLFSKPLDAEAMEAYLRSRGPGALSAGTASAVPTARFPRLTLAKGA